jgi:hypothetical protein
MRNANYDLHAQVNLCVNLSYLTFLRQSLDEDGHSTITLCAMRFMLKSNAKFVSAYRVDRLRIDVQFIMQDTFCSSP